MTILDALFGCSHKRKTFPITSKRGQRCSNAAGQTGTYVVCLDCGKEFAYDWDEMRIRKARPQHIYSHSRVEAEAS